MAVFTVSRVGVVDNSEGLASCRYQSFARLVGPSTAHRFEPKHPPLLTPIHRHFSLSSAHHMKIQMTRLPPIQDRPNDVRGQPRHP